MYSTTRTSIHEYTVVRIVYSEAYCTAVLLLAGTRTWSSVWARRCRSSRALCCPPRVSCARRRARRTPPRGPSPRCLARCASGRATASASSSGVGRRLHPHQPLRPRSRLRTGTAPRLAMTQLGSLGVCQLRVPEARRVSLSRRSMG